MVFDIKFENRPVVTGDGVRNGVSVGVSEGRIAAVGTPASLGTAERVVDLDGQYLIPGIVDCHVHTRSPGYEYKEDWTTATAAAAAGGVTTLLAMPNTSSTRPTGYVRSTTSPTGTRTSTFSHTRS
jgi:dihydroorotase/allantoinase